MPDARQLQHLLQQLDQRGYKAYKQIQGSYQFPDFKLHIDYVQGDPFAAPSRLRVAVPQSTAGFPVATFCTRSREIALRDYLNRQFSNVANRLREKRGSGNSGLIAIATPGQQVLERSAVWVNADTVEARFVVGLPARGRQILGHTAALLLCEELPQIIHQTLRYAALDATALNRHLETVEDADWLRQQLASRHLIAFIPDDAVLPRQSGISQKPLETDAVPFRSPTALRVEFQRPNQGKITGMGIPTGVTLMVGGGYHGKSTLLQAIALGIYNHIPGDGREQLVTAPDAVKIRAEDGRSVAGVNISPFINHLPQGRSTTHFSTENASGSTSQAASLIEALEAGTTLFLVDEDTSATNFMIRDRRMQALIAKDQEPITPLIDKIQQLYQEHGVSTLLVMGGSGDYFEVADTVIAMIDYQPHDVTEQAKAIATHYPSGRVAEGGSDFGSLTSRIPHPQRLDASKVRRGRWEHAPETIEASGRDHQETRSGAKLEEHDGPLNPQDRPPKLKVRGENELILGSETVDLSAIEQIVESGQIRAIGAAIAYLQQHHLNGSSNLASILQEVSRDLNWGGLDALTPYPQGDLVSFRTLELAAAINRLRSLDVLL